MSITVEFYGIPRARVGVDKIHVCQGAPVTSLRQVIAEVAAQFPAFAESCTHHGTHLRHGYIANIDGEQFVHAHDDATISSGQSVLILSADAGG